MRDLPPSRRLIETLTSSGVFFRASPDQTRTNPTMNFSNATESERYFALRLVGDGSENLTSFLKPFTRDDESTLA